MELAKHKIVIIDSSTLGKVARDFWSREPNAKYKAQGFISELKNRGVFVAFTLTQVSELLRHENEIIADDRRRFLKQLPLIAWLRPYDRNWFPGTVACLYTRELHAVMHGSARSWKEIVDYVRPDLWETGTGAEMFVDDDELWKAIRSVSMQQLDEHNFIASMTRLQLDPQSNLTVEECQNMEMLPRSEWDSTFRQLTENIRNQLEKHGDRRLENASSYATSFTRNTQSRVEILSESEIPIIDAQLEYYRVPRELVGPKTTVGEIGQLAVYAIQLEIFREHLRPPCSLTMLDVPIDTLPAYVIERRLAAIQQRAERVSGSDLGDAHLAAVTLYADAVQVDKRTFEYLRQLSSADMQIGVLMGEYFKESDYSKIPEKF